MMSTTKKKQVKNIRDIFDQPHGTEDYREKMVGHWISYQQNQPASLHEPTVLESHAPSATQKSRLPPSSKSQQHKEMYNSVNEQQRMKQRKHHKIVSNFDFDMQPQFDNMDEPLFELDMSNGRSNSNNNNNRYYDNNRMFNDTLTSKTKNRSVKQSDPKQKYESNIGGNECNAHYHHHHYHQSQGHSIDVRPSNKRKKSSIQHFDNDDLVEFGDLQFDFDVDQTEVRRQQQQQQLVRKENKKNVKNIDEGLQSDPFIDFDSCTGAFDDIGKQPTPQFIYKRFKERSYAELMGTTPKWQHTDIDLHKKDAVQIMEENNDDAFLFKHPAAILCAEQNAIGKIDLHDERDSSHHHHREPRVKNRRLNQQYVISHEVEKFIPKTSDADKEFHVMQMGQNRTATATSTQPNTFYIKCNNLIIKHD